MNYHIEINGQWHKMSKEQAEQLIEQGVIKRETRVRLGEKIGTAGKLLYFSPTAGKQSSCSDEKDESANIAPRPIRLWRNEKEKSFFWQFLESWYRFFVRITVSLFLVALLVGFVWFALKMFAPADAIQKIQQNMPKNSSILVK